MMNIFTDKLSETVIGRLYVFSIFVKGQFTGFFVENRIRKLNEMQSYKADKRFQKLSSGKKYVDCLYYKICRDVACNPNAYGTGFPQNSLINDFVCEWCHKMAELEKPERLDGEFSFIERLKIEALSQSDISIKIESLKVTGSMKTLGVGVNERQPVMKITDYECDDGEETLSLQTNNEVEAINAVGEKMISDHQRYVLWRIFDYGQDSKEIYYNHRFYCNKYIPGQRKPANKAFFELHSREKVYALGLHDLQSLCKELEKRGLKVADLCQKRTIAKSNIFELMAEVDFEKNKIILVEVSYDGFNFVPSAFFEIIQEQSDAKLIG